MKKIMLILVAMVGLAVNANAQVNIKQYQDAQRQQKESKDACTGKREFDACTTSSGYSGQCGVVTRNTYGTTTNTTSSNTNTHSTGNNAGGSIGGSIGTNTSGNASGSYNRSWGNSNSQTNSSTKQSVVTESRRTLECQ